MTRNEDEIMKFIAEKSYELGGYPYDVFKGDQGISATQTTDWPRGSLRVFRRSASKGFQRALGAVYEGCVLESNHEAKIRWISCSTTDS
ncbi:hypothetical protein EB061_04520 [bacterium]|nr:hypothetical protein [bacterium]